MTDSFTPDPIADFEAERSTRIASYPGLADWQAVSAKWTEHAFHHHYLYNFAWMGRPVIQIPVDIMAIQEIVWAVQPDLIIETGIAHGGSLIMSASFLAMLDVCDAARAGTTMDPRKSARRVLGVDIDIRAHNRAAIEAHPMSHMITMIQGSSLDQGIIDQVKAIAANYKRVLVCLDSNHTHDHVLAEMEAYAPLTSKGSYCLVLDGIVEDLPADAFPNRPWGPGNNPKTALRAYLALLASEGRKAADGQPLHLVRDAAIEDKLLVSAAPEGYLKRV